MNSHERIPRRGRSVGCCYAQADSSNGYNCPVVICADLLRRLVGYLGMNMIKRYDLSREYRGNIGTPAITEQPEGEYVLYDDYAAVFDELRAEKAGLEAIVAAQAGEIERLRQPWRPIETAPRDGEIIILGLIDETTVMIREGRWDSAAGKWTWPWICGLAPAMWMQLPPEPVDPSGESNG